MNAPRLTLALLALATIAGCLVALVWNLPAVTS